MTKRLGCCLKKSENVVITPRCCIDSNNILGTNAENPLPASTSDETLANEFADFFMNKIQKIRDALDKHPKYNPCSKEVVSLDSFKLLSEKQVTFIIASMSTKSCDLDVLPTQLLKDILDRSLTPITHLVNTSLQKGPVSKSIVFVKGG